MGHARGSWMGSHATAGRAWRRMGERERARLRVDTDARGHGSDADTGIVATPSLLSTPPTPRPRPPRNYPLSWNPERGIRFPCAHVSPVALRQQKTWTSQEELPTGPRPALAHRRRGKKSGTQSQRLAWRVEATVGVESVACGVAARHDRGWLGETRAQCTPGGAWALLGGHGYRPAREQPRCRNVSSSLGGSGRLAGAKFINADAPFRARVISFARRGHSRGAGGPPSV